MKANTDQHIDAYMVYCKSMTAKEVNAFAKKLEKEGISATVRRTLGQDIDGACGQLRAAHEAKAQEEA